MNASSRVYIDAVIIWAMMSFYQQILHCFSCYKVLCIGNLAYAGHFAVSPSSHQYALGTHPTRLSRQAPTPPHHTPVNTTPK